MSNSMLGSVAYNIER